jgi:DNA-binding protein Fis
MEVAGGHKGRAADLLGVSRPRLNRLIEKYGLE